MKLYGPALAAFMTACLPSALKATTSAEDTMLSSTRMCLLSENAPEFTRVEDRIAARDLEAWSKGKLTMNALAGRLLVVTLRNPGIDRALKDIMDAKKGEGLDVESPAIKAELIIRFLAAVNVMEQRGRLCPERTARLAF